MSTTRPQLPDDRPGQGGPGARASVSGDLPGAGGVPGTGGVPGSGGASAPGGRQTRSLSLAGESGVVPMARDFARQALHAWGWLPADGAERKAAAEDVLLVVSELVTNACLHAEGPEELVIGTDGKTLRIEVADLGAGEPEPRRPHQAGRPGGHGMFIVQRLSVDWGVARAEGVPGKRVWAEVAAPA